MEAHIEPVEGEPTRWWIRSLTQANTVHMVDLDDDGAPACSCQDFMCRGRVCKHIRAVKQFVSGHRPEPIKPFGKSAGFSTGLVSGLA